MNAEQTAGSDRILERMQSLHPKFIDLTLDRCWPLLAALDAPHTRLPAVIHIAGTNGKGSTLAMIRAGLEGTGAQVHAYTSPHLARFNERIYLAGRFIEETALEALLQEVYAANQEQEITYFEITTIAAMAAMARTPADFTLLEVGLGGRLDATNVIAKPALTVITPIDFDHQQFLGDTIEEIAGEKAGILKPGVACVVGPQRQEALTVIEDKAARMGAPLFIHGQHWHVGTEAGRLVYQDETGLCDVPLPGLAGPHQIKNAGMAIAALRKLGAGSPDHAMTKVSWPARMQRIQQGPLLDAAPGWEIWLDGGHNPAAAGAIRSTLEILPARPTHLILGMLHTKDCRGFLENLAAFGASLTTVPIPEEAGTMIATELAQIAQSMGFPARPAADLEKALTQIVAQHPAGRIVICGSLYLAGHILRHHG